MIGKRLRDCTSDDVDALISQEVQEDDEIEFKGDLPSDNGGRRSDHWYGGGKVGKKAKSEIIEEVIAFANWHGGTVIVGIDETKAKPARAHELAPIPRCAALEDVFKRVCRDWIEPRLAMVDIRGIPTAADGSGVLAIQVPQSMAAPHRHKDTLECYIRRADSSEAMTMREIQDLTLQRDRGIAGIEQRFDERRASLGGPRAGVWDTRSGFTIQATLMPLSKIYVSQIHNNQAFEPPLQDFTARREGQQHKQQVRGPTSETGSWIPIIRGTRKTDGNDHLEMQREVHCDGLIEYTFHCSLRDGDYDLLSFWIVYIFANALCAAEKFRLAANASGVEYGLEYSIDVEGALQLVDFQEPRMSSIRYMIGKFPDGLVSFPRYRVGAPEEFQILTSKFQTDLHHHIGVDQFVPYQLDFDAALSEG